MPSSAKKAPPSVPSSAYVQTEPLPAKKAEGETASKIDDLAAAIKKILVLTEDTVRRMDDVEARLAANGVSPTVTKKGSKRTRN